MRQLASAILLLVGFLALGCHKAEQRGMDARQQAESSETTAKAKNLGLIAQNSNATAYTYDANDTYATTEEEEAKGTEGDGLLQPKIIKEGDLGIYVDDYAKARASLDGLLEKHGGYISREDETKSRSWLNNQMEIRIPSKHFEALVEGVMGLSSKVRYKRLGAEDVTQAFLDLESRLKVKRQVRSKYESFLESAKDVEEMLAIEREIRILTEDIEANETQLRYLSNQVDFSTLRLEIIQKLKYEYEDPEYAQPSFWQRLGRGLGKGWDGVLSFLVVLSHLWPLAIVGVILFFLIKWRGSRQKGS